MTYFEHILHHVSVSECLYLYSRLHSAPVLPMPYISVVRSAPTEGSFDAAFAHHALHHVSDLETLTSCSISTHTNNIPSCTSVGTVYIHRVGLEHGRAGGAAGAADCR